MITMRPDRRAQSGSGYRAGFTLVEVLVAVFIFAIVGVMAMSGYNELSAQSIRVEENAARIRAVQSAVMRIGQDFATLEPRPVREPLSGEVEPALRADKRLAQLVELTHSGWSNPAGVARPTLQRVAYRLQDNKLMRDYWVALDRTMSSEPVTVVLLDRVKTATLRFMGADQVWKDEWPPTGYSANDAKSLRPIAVEITLELDDWGNITRLIEVSG